MQVGMIRPIDKRIAFKGDDGDKKKDPAVAVADGLDKTAEVLDSTRNGVKNAANAAEGLAKDGTAAAVKVGFLASVIVNPIKLLINMFKNPVIGEDGKPVKEVIKLYNKDVEVTKRVEGGIFDGWKTWNKNAVKLGGAIAGVAAVAIAIALIAKKSKANKAKKEAELAEQKKLEEEKAKAELAKAEALKAEVEAAKLKAEAEKAKAEKTEAKAEVEEAEEASDKEEE